MEILWTHLDHKSWQDRLQGRAHGLRQSWGYGQAMVAMGARLGRALVVENGVELAQVQVLQRRGLRVINDGPVWLRDVSPDQQRRVLRGFARHPGVTIATPPSAQAGWGLVPLITPQSHAVWRIDRDTGILRAGLQGKWRNRLLKAETGLRISALPMAGVETLIHAEAIQRQARGYTNLPGALARHWPEERLALGWYSSGVLQAGMVFLQHGRTASYFLGWASPVARARFAHGPILWQAALTLRDRGVQQLDLGALDSEGGAALARFKLGTGAAVRVAGSTCLVMP